MRKPWQMSCLVFFCIENQLSDEEGMKHLRIALDLHKQWGALNKAAVLEQFIKDKTKQ